MPCGLFGKLPAKRDFVAVNTPREFMTCWEQWLQGGISASKIELTTNWLSAYLSAPLWRFWIGSGICGLPVAGAFMPSVDGVGRHFPLTVFDCGDAADSLAMPMDTRSGPWYEGVENFLLSALEPETDYATLLSELDLLPLTARTPAQEEAAGQVTFFHSRIQRAEGIESIPDTFVALEADRDRTLKLRSSYWWTIGGEGFSPAAIIADGLPDPHILGAMLTGKFEPRSL